jgi:hypothetical protein
MAQITLTFDSYEELVSFSEKLLSREGGMETSAVSTAVPATEVKQAESYGQQIAPHFPEANTSAQLNQQAQNQVTQSVAPTQAVPIAVPTYTREDLSKAAMSLMDKGMQAQLQQLIQSFGVSSLVELPAEQYGSFATAIREMGAQI